LKRKIFSVLLTLVMLLTMSIVTAAPVGAEPVTIEVPADHTTIQAAINAASEGDTINVAAGTYTENIDVDKHVKIIGAGSGTDGTVITQNTAGAGDPYIGVVQVNASGNSEADPLLFQNLRIEPVGMAGFSVGSFMAATGTTVSYVKLDNVKVVGTNLNPSTEQERGFYVNHTSTVNNLVVSNCSFDNLTYGWYFHKEVSDDTSTVQNVVVTDTTFNHNCVKGIYAEKLSEATFTRCTASENGWWSEGFLWYDFSIWMCGIDINLKAGTYQNITFTDCTVTNNALGGAREGVGLCVKGRGTGNDAGYAANPGPVDNVQIIGGTFTGNERGIRFGEPGKVLASPTNVKVSNVNISGNVQTYIGDDGSPYGGLINSTSVEVDATDNWWGHASGPHASPGLGDTISGNVLYNPWLLEPKGATYDKTLALKDGWTLVSTDKAVASSAWVGTNPLAKELPETIMAYKYTPTGFVSEATLTVPLTAIYVKTEGGGGVGFNYVEVGPTTVYSKDLEAGWNLIGIPDMGKTNIGDILSPLRYVTIGTQQGIGLTTLVSQGDYNQFSGSFYEATLTDGDWSDIPGFDPFDGYWAYMEGADTFEVIPQ